MVDDCDGTQQQLFIGMDQSNKARRIKQMGNKLLGVLRPAHPTLRFSFPNGSCLIKVNGQDLCNLESIDSDTQAVYWNYEAVSKFDLCKDRAMEAYNAFYSKGTPSASTTWRL